VKWTLPVLVGRVDRVLPLSQKPPDKILPAGLNRLVKWQIKPVVFEPQICGIFFQDFQGAQLTFGGPAMCWAKNEKKKLFQEWLYYTDILTTSF
jgi:hypothetical protein